jgi:tRNA (guanine-N(7)-)-methyltransferase
MPRRTKPTPAAEAIALVLETPAALPLAEAFPRRAPLEIDLGCGDGLFVAAMAEQHPERNFLGIERLRGRVASACKKIAARGLTNARIVRVDLAVALAELLPAASVSRFHLLFPDPWPKRRHHVRRIVTPEWLRLVARALVPGGSIRMVTDEVEYFAQMQRALAAVPQLRRETGDGVSRPASRSGVGRVETVRELAPRVEKVRATPPSAPPPI